MAWQFVADYLKNPEKLRVGLERMLEARRGGLRGNPEVEAKAWLDKLAEVETTRAGYQELAAKGLMTFEELAARLDELESTRQTAQRELAALEGKRDELRALEQDAAALLETYENTIPEQLDNLTPEERHHIYKLLQLRCLLRPDEPPELTGVFMANAPKVRKTEGPRTNTSTLTWPRWRCCFREEGLSSFD
jgi:site-specific DNA recombinase